MGRRRRKITPISTLEIVNVTNGKRKITKLQDFYKKRRKKRKKAPNNGK
jgi:hypothetical protein|tara:strand:+ start:94 stop:240 length:147 start_codon:yes stop_codon:yes gene_type:complete